MFVEYGYKKWNTRDWIITQDLGERFLQCPDCGCGIVLKYYNMACGTDALSFCPYCGKKRNPKKPVSADKRQITVFEILEGGN